MSKTKLCLLSFFLFCISQSIHAQVEKITPELINLYGLEFSSHDQSKPFSLTIGTQFLIDQGHDVSIGTLYLLIKNLDIRLLPTHILMSSMFMI